jgi:hypothetical protein
MIDRTGVVLLDVAVALNVHDEVVDHDNAQVNGIAAQSACRVDVRRLERARAPRRR